MSKENQILSSLEESSELSDVQIERKINKANVFVDGEMTKKQFDEMVLNLKKYFPIGEEKLKSDISSFKDISYVLKTAKENGNIVFNGKYNNEPEYKEYLKNALRAMSAMFQLNIEIEDTINSMNNVKEKFEENILNYTPGAVVSLMTQKLTANASDIRRAYIVSSAKRRKKKRIAGIIALIVGVFFNYYFSIGSTSTAFLGFFGIILEIVGIVNLVKSSYKKYLKAPVEGVMKGTSFSADEKRDMSSLLNVWEKNAKNKLSKSKLKQIYSTQLKNSSQEAVEILSHWTEFENEYRKELDEYKEVGYKSIALALEMLPKEFRGEKEVRDLYDLIESNRADTLKEAYPILEARYREEKRDAEERAFRESQMASQKRTEEAARQQAAAAEKAAQYQREQAEYARRQAEEAAIAAKYQRDQAEYQKQQAEASKKIAEHAEKEEFRYHQDNPGKY